MTVKNSGSAALTLSSIAIVPATPASYTQTNTCGTGLAAGASCSITVTFTPQATGTIAATVNVTDNAAGSPQTISLTGTGVVSGPVAMITPSTLTFASTAVGTTAATQSISLKNTGTKPLTLSAIAVSGTGATSFMETNNCPASVAINGVCTVTVTFNPKSTGSLSAAVNFTDNAGGSPQKVIVSGVGTAPVVSLSASSLNFASTAVGSSAASQAVTLKNTGTGALTISGLSIAGTNASSFTETNTCGSGLAIGASCTITVTFKPTVVGANMAAIKIADNATGSPQSINLTGTATGPSVSLTPTSLTFAATPVGTFAATQTVTVKNTGTGPLTIASVGLTGTNASSFSLGKTCGTTLAASASCTVTVGFKPVAAGALSAALKLTDNAAGGSQSVSILGTGAQAAAVLNSTAVTFGNTAVGSSALTQTIRLSNTGNAALSLSGSGRGISVSGTAATSFSQTNTCGTTVAAGSSCLITLAFKPTTTGTLTATLAVGDSATNSPQKVTLTGTGVGAQAVLSTSALTYTSTRIGTTVSQTITLTNTGNQTLGLSGSGRGIGITGANAGSFAETNTCGVALVAGAHCTITITFKPTGTGPLAASLTLTDNAVPATQSVKLNGTGA